MPTIIVGYEKQKKAKEGFFFFLVFFKCCKDSVILEANTLFKCDTLIDAHGKLCANVCFTLL